MNIDDDTLIAYLDAQLEDDAAYETVEDALAASPALRARLQVLAETGELARQAFDAKLDALAKLTRSIAINRGHADQALVDAFFAAGWTTENLVDVIVTIGDKTVTNYLHATTRVPVDFPAAPALTVAMAA